VKESLNPERWLCRHASFKALAHFVTIRMPLNRAQQISRERLGLPAWKLS
jgi:hypothetical protein